MKFLTRQEIMVLVTLLGLLLTGAAVKMYRTASEPAAVPEPAEILEP